MIPEVGKKGKLGQKATCVSRTVAFFRVKSNDNVTGARWLGQMIMLPGLPLLSLIFSDLGGAG